MDDANGANNPSSAAGIIRVHGNNSSPVSNMVRKRSFTAIRTRWVNHKNRHL